MRAPKSINVTLIARLNAHRWQCFAAMDEQCEAMSNSRHCVRLAGYGVSYRNAYYIGVSDVSGGGD